MKTNIQEVKVGEKKYAYKKTKPEPLHETVRLKFEKIELVGKIWGTVFQNWGVKGKRVRGKICLQKCLSLKTCPIELTEEQFAIILESPINYRQYFKYREKAGNNSETAVRVYDTTKQSIELYIEKYKALLPAEAEPETPTEQPAPENISN